MDEADKQTAQKLVRANSVNLYCSEVQIRFIETAGLSGSVNFVNSLKNS